MNSTSLSIVVPAYNEEDGISGVLLEIRTRMEQAGLEFEIIVVDDGSEDGTLNAVHGIAGVECAVHGANLGYGAAIKTGIGHARFPLICILDGDGTYPVGAIPALLARFEQDELDMVIGARTGKKSSVPLLRRPAKWALGVLANRISGKPIPDVNSGLRVFRKTAIDPFWNLLPDGFSFTTTITLAMITNGYRVGFLEIDYLKRVGRSKINPIKDTVNFFLLVLRIGLYFAPLKIFIPLSGLIILIGVLWGAASLVLFDRLADASTMVIIMAGVQTAVVGLLAELINRRMPNHFRNDRENR